jgi:hypothetical protein
MTKPNQESQENSHTKNDFFLLFLNTIVNFFYREEIGVKKEEKGLFSALILR